MATEHNSRYLETISNPDAELSDSQPSEALDVTDILESPTVCDRRSANGSGGQVRQAGIRSLWPQAKQFFKDNWMWLLVATAFYWVNQDTFQVDNKAKEGTENG